MKTQPPQRRYRPPKEKAVTMREFRRFVAFIVEGCGHRLAALGVDRLKDDGQTFSFAWNPRGGKGPQGEPGVEGPTGPPGDIPPPGPPGVEGARGMKGLPGPPGPRGDTGPKGPTGDKGAAGDVGDQGDNGDPGDPGPPGPTGPPHPDPETGDPGPPGTDGIEFAGPPGEDATEPGPPGPPGADGADGADGPNGYPGDEGFLGPEGPPGPDGDPTKTAILETSRGIIAMHAMEGEEALFKDVITLPIAPHGFGAANLCPTLREVCEPGSLFVLHAFIPTSSALIGARVVTMAGRVWIEADVRPPPRQDITATLTVAGVRKGFSGSKLPLFTRQQMAANNRFYAQAHSSF